MCQYAANPMAQATKPQVSFRVTTALTACTAVDVFDTSSTAAIRRAGVYASFANIRLDT